MTQVGLTAGAVLAGAAWLLSRRRDLRLPPFTGVAVLALAATLFQLVPLPAGLVEFISPRALELRSDALGFRPAVLPLTMDVPATLLAATRGLACLLVVVLAASATRRGKAYFLVVGLVCTSALVAALSFLQRGLGAETILGFYRVSDMPGSGFFGTFIAGNHAASFFTLGALLALGCARETDGSLRVLFAGCSVLCLAGLLSTMSRFGVIGFAAGGFAMLTLWLMRLFGSKRGLLAAGVAALILLPLVVGLALGQRNHWRTSAGMDPLHDFKVRGWADAGQLAIRFPLAGVGRGAFEAPATAFRDQAEQVRLAFPENLLLEVVTEWGVPISLALIALFAWAAWPIVRRLHRWEPMYQAAACSVFAIMVHDLADFGLEVLGVAMPTAMALGICAGRRQMSLESSMGSGDRIGVGEPAPPATGLRRLPAQWAATLARISRMSRFIAIATGLVVVGAVGIVGGAAWAASRTSDEDGARIRAAIANPAASDPAATEAQLTEAIARHPADYDFALLAARWAMRQTPPSPKALRQLNRAQRLYPAAATPHLFTAHLLVQLGRPSQAAIELRLANELGANLSYAQMEHLVGTVQLERAIPRDPEHLLNLASYLLGAGRIAQVRAATNRAVFFADNSEDSLTRQMNLALATQDKAFIAEAARALGKVASSAESFELAMRGFASTGQLEAARTLIRKATLALPHDGSVTIKGARILMENGDPSSARALLAEIATRNLAFAERIAGEELLAEIADKAGDPHAAAAARARARILAQMRSGSGDAAGP